MYTKQEESKQKQAFWTAFGQYMKPILSADCESVNWINYKTGIPGIYFRMNAGHKQASIAIELTHTDIELQASYYEQLQGLKQVLHETLGEEWQWQLLTEDDYGKTISSITTQINNVNIARQEDWPLLITFFKQRIIALDSFWSMAKYSFER